ncbi:MAG TPA: TIR domain-containing protein [Accumulibacter sp.]|uniref:TIR domain-containing protein n=1 Tax=Accumulibacter sp. TaxID=2053492 RepID=UPI002C18C112|nr:TIR domain-containing protein [Accumulibacter sp.]HRD88727.1 TIR domain-containing protein [Accumulibacter sp.]
MVARPLSPRAAKRAAAKLVDDLGRTDRRRLEDLLGLLADDGRISLADALQALFPDQAREAALTAFRQFRSRLREIVAELGVRFSLEADSQTRAAPEERWCWFEGDDGAVETATRLAMEETGNVERSGLSAIELTETRDGKPLIRYFVSYAHQDKSESERLLRQLQNQLGIARDYAFEAWTDRDILPGEEWHEEIQGAIARCQFGLLLVSTAFLGSKYITAHELPAFVAGEPGTADPGKRAIPVALKRVLLDGSMDLKGLERRQIFHDNSDRAFAERTTDKTREDFARELFQKILAVVAGRFTQPPTPTAARSLTPRERAEIAQRRYIDEAVDWSCHVPTQGFASAMHKLESEPEKPAAEVQRADALAFLDDWLGNPQAQPYCALLGELGMGKTTTCMAFARSLLERRKHDPAAPLPIYLDLRHLGDRAKGEPELKQILESVLVKSWRGGHGEPDLTADEAIRLVQSEGAVAIFDGLDEVLVHLSAAGGQRFVREVFRLLPPVTRAGKAQAGANPAVRPGRLLMACRTHFFRTLREQKNFFTAEDRDGVRAEDYRAFVLLPFSEEQIRGYLARTLPDQDPGRVLDLIRAVHNLSEMAERPYTLSLISRHIPQIERWKLEGRSVTGVMLYRHMVLSWLERDDGKHQILPDHKRRLMEYLAAELWRAGRRVWSVGELEQWLIDFLARRPDIAAHYEGKDRELLKEDLRTATFLVREGEDSFRFAHTSLQEFFLAGYLLDALLDGTPESWALPMPSPETLDFLGQLLVEDASVADKALATLRELRDTRRPQASELAFSYALLALRKGYPAPSTVGFRLDGADLRDWEIRGR